MRNTRVHGENLVRFAADKPNIVVLSADLTSSCEADLFRERYPERFFSMGMAEQNMLSFAGGLAREGFIPFVHTFSVFLYRRALDQLAMSIAYPNLPVKLLGFLPGITTPGGATHQAIEDISVLRAIPNLTILETGDATEVESVLDTIYNTPGPVYTRMLRGEIPRLFPLDQPFQIGKARVISQGRDLLLISSGIATEESLTVTEKIIAAGISLEHLHVSTLKPFDDPQIEESIINTRYGVITMENQVITGGLGSAVADIIAGLGIARRLVKIGLKDTFAHGGSRTYLARYYNLDGIALIAAVGDLCMVDIPPPEYPPRRTDALRKNIATEKPEDL